MPSAARDAGRLVCRDALDRLLLAAAARGVHRQSCLPLDHLPVLGRHADLVGADRSSAVAGTAREQAVDADAVRRLDVEAVRRRRRTGPGPGLPPGRCCMPRSRTAGPAR